METHAWFKRVYKKLSTADIKLMEQFVIENDHLDINDFEMKAARMFIDNPNKPKNWTRIQELIVNSNVF